jgi:hypothetical protein
MSKKTTLPDFFYPLYETDLIRFGKDNDGGYLIPKKSLDHTKLLYSFGLNDDFSFEKDFYNTTGAKIICYDYAITWKFFFKMLLMGDYKSPFKYLKHKVFFDNKNKTHIQKYIAPIGTFHPFIKADKIDDINSMLIDSSLNGLFFKIDIEGSEYRLLDQLIKYAPSMTGLVIEFHDCDLHYNKIKNFIENFKLDLVHVHVNNCDFVSNKEFPRALELTFSPNEFNKKIINEKKKFPISLDQSNTPGLQDYPLEFND